MAKIPNVAASFASVSLGGSVQMSATMSSANVVIDKMHVGYAIFSTMTLSRGDMTDVFPPLKAIGRQETQIRAVNEEDDPSVGRFLRIV